jgi:hypothetical protein
MSTVPGRAALLASAAFFVLFLADVVGGRLLTLDGGGGTGVPAVVQFLVFFASVVCFAVALLQKERARDEARENLSAEA